MPLREWVALPAHRSWSFLKTLFLLSRSSDYGFLHADGSTSVPCQRYMYVYIYIFVCVGGVSLERSPTAGMCVGFPVCVRVDAGATVGNPMRVNASIPSPLCVCVREKQLHRGHERGSTFFSADRIL